MSGSIPSAFGDPNILYKSLSGLGTAEVLHNQLLNQAEQQDITAHDFAMVGQAAAPLLGMSEEDAAKAYPGIISELQARGGAKYAPATYPGHAATAALVQRAMTLPQQFETGFLTSPALDALFKSVQAPLPGMPGFGATGAGAGGGGAGGGAKALTGDLETDRKIIAQRESGGDPRALNYVAVADPTAYGRGATASGKYQFVNSTWREGLQLAGLDPAQYPTAMSAPESVQDKVFTAVYSKYGTKPWDPSTYGQAWVPAPGGRFVLAKGATSPTTAAAAPGASTAPGVVVGDANRPDLAPPPPGAPQGAYAGGGIGTALNPTAPIATKGTPLPAGKLQTTGKPPGVAETPIEFLPRTQFAGPGVPTGAQPPGVEPPPQPGWGTGTPGSYGYGGGSFAQAAPLAPASSPASPAAPASAQPPTAAAPSPASIPTGVNSIQYQQAMELQRRALMLDAAADPTGRNKLLAAGLRQQAQLLLQTDSVVQLPDGRQLHPLTGKIDDPAKPLPHYVWDATQGAWVDLSGTNKPEAAPTPRATEGAATWDEQQQKWVPATPGKPGAVQGKWTLTGAGLGTFLPAAPVPAQGNYDIAVEDLKKDRGEIAAIGDAGRAAQQDNLRVQEMRDILQHADTGPGSETAAHLRAWIARWTPGELSKWDGSGANLSNAAAIEMFQKLGFVGAVTQERGSTPRGGYQATKLFQQFNPGAQMLTSTNQGLLAQRLIANQAEVDYAQAAQEHYNTQHQRLKGPERDYTPLSDFDAKWQAQRNPQVYAAAIGALGGQDSEIWSRGLSKDEIQRVKGVVQRADPNAVIKMPGEGTVVLQPNAKPVPPGFKVQ